MEKHVAKLRWSVRESKTMWPCCGCALRPCQQEQLWAAAAGYLQHLRGTLQVDAVCRLKQQRIRVGDGKRSTVMLHPWRSETVSTNGLRLRVIYGTCPGLMDLWTCDLQLKVSWHDDLISACWLKQQHQKIMRTAYETFIEHHWALLSWIPTLSWGRQWGWLTTAWKSHAWRCSTQHNFRSCIYFESYLSFFDVHGALDTIIIHTRNITT